MPDVGHAVTRSDEGFIIAGHKNNVNGSLDALYLLGLDQDGNMTWEKTYINEHSYRANDIIPAGDWFVVAGRYWGRMYFLKIDSHGNKIWETTIPYIREEATSITEAGDGGFIFTANSDFFVGKIQGTPIPMPEFHAGVIPLLVLLTFLKFKLRNGLRRIYPQVQPSRDNSFCIRVFPHQIYCISSLKRACISVVT